jgi:hypothetical protein
VSIGLLQRLIDLAFSVSDSFRTDYFINRLELMPVEKSCEDCQQRFSRESNRKTHIKSRNQRYSSNQLLYGIVGDFVRIWRRFFRTRTSRNATKSGFVVLKFIRYHCFSCFLMSTSRGNCANEKCDIICLFFLFGFLLRKSMSSIYSGMAHSHY